MSGVLAPRSNSSFRSEFWHVSWLHGPDFQTFVEKQRLVFWNDCASSQKQQPCLIVCVFVGVVQSLSCVWLFVTPWTTARQASLPITSSQSLLKLVSIESVMPFNHLILCRPLLLLPSVFPSIRVFSNESALCIRWPKDWSFSFSISPSNEYSGLICLGCTGLISLQSKGFSRVFNTTVQKHQFFAARLSLWSNSHIHMWPLEKP